MACVNSGTVAYSHAVGWVMTRAYRSDWTRSAQPGSPERSPGHRASMPWWQPHLAAVVPSAGRHACRGSDCTLSPAKAVPGSRRSRPRSR
ncbi:Uncharacterised protein [Mycobacterium tuberculosis]|nr:Uncharacterised protein [Mycobacterium tuberculosis]